MKFPIKTILFLAISGFLLVALVINFNFPSSEHELVYISPTDGYVNKKVNLYFVNLGGIDSKEMYVAVDSRSLEENVLKLLEESILREEGESFFDSGLSINSMETINKTCYIDLNGPVDFFEDSSEKEALFIFSLVNTLTDLDHIDRVQFSQDGKAIEKNIGIYDLTEPFTYNAHFIKSKSKTPDEFVRLFLHHIILGQTDVAYSMLCQNTMRDLPFLKFVNIAKFISYDFDFYNIGDMHYELESQSDYQTIYTVYLEMLPLRDYLGIQETKWTVIDDKNKGYQLVLDFFYPDLEIY